MKGGMLLAGLILALGGGCYSARVEYARPEPPAGFVLIDAYDAGHPEDYVKFHNAGSFNALTAQVQFHNPKTRNWEPFGGATLKGPGDTDTMKHSTDVGGGLGNLRYFAVRFSDDKPHAFNVSGAHHDLHVFVGDAQ